MFQGKIDVKCAVPREKITSNKLFVGGLTQEVHTRDLAEYVQKHFFQILDQNYKMF